MKYCDETPGILKWSSEEVVIPYISPLDGQRHRYFPDVYLESRAANGKMKCLIIEIKPKSQANWPTTVRATQKRRTRKYLKEAMTYAVNQAKWAAATKFCASRGWQFMVMTEDHLFNRVHI
jgi:hypothetical protein